MYTAYKVTILMNGTPRTVTGNWAAIMNTIYDAIGEDAAKRCAITIGELQAEMFFGQDVHQVIIDSENKFRITVSTVLPKEGD